MWALNKGILTGVVKPTAKVYRAVVVKPVRVGIGNMGTNITYPDRLINNLLQGKWRGARDETYRFLCNSTIGVAGFFDVASKWKIGRFSADFRPDLCRLGLEAELFHHAADIRPQRRSDTVGLAADEAANPLLYILPYTLNAENPLGLRRALQLFQLRCRV